MCSSVLNGCYILCPVFKSFKKKNQDASSWICVLFMYESELNVAFFKTPCLQLYSANWQILRLEGDYMEAAIFVYPMPDLNSHTDPPKENQQYGKKPIFSVYLLSFVFFAVLL